MTIWAEPFGCGDGNLPNPSFVRRGYVEDCVLDSPDETANYFWAKRVGEGRELWYYEPLNSIGNNLLKPRSFNVTEGRVVPGSFLGEILLYGSIAKWFGAGVLPYLTPLFASLAVIAFGLMVGRLFGREVGVISAALLAFLPPWWYYGARGMYHNVLFVSLVIIGIYLLAVLIDRRDKGNKGDRAGESEWTRLAGWGVAGLLIGYAVVVRSSEIVWVTLLIMAIWLYGYMAIWKRRAWREFPLPGLLLFIGCGLFALVPLFTTNIVLYGAPLSLSYQGMQGMEIGEFVSRLSTPPLRNLFFAPFGFDLYKIAKTAKAFLIDQYPWWSWSVAAGLVFAYMRAVMNKEWKWLRFCAGYMVVSMVLIVYYGAWEFSDRIDRQTLSLNTSFFRYWLPVYIMGIPCISLVIAQLTQRIKWQWLKMIVILLALALFAYPSGQRILYETDESLIPIQSRQIEARAERMAAIRNLPPHAVVITFPQADKVLFPAFTRVIIGLHNDGDYKAVKRVTKLVPVYVYSYLPPETVAAKTSKLFEPFGMSLEQGKKIFKDRWVWKVGEKKL